MAQIRSRGRTRGRGRADAADKRGPGRQRARADRLAGPRGKDAGEGERGGGQI
jgi:hypothetical protein